MKLIIAGGRDLFVTPEFISHSLIAHRVFDKAHEIVSGGAKGIDSCGEDAAKKYGLLVKVFPADWTTHGPKAGPLRNAQMAEYADALLLIWNGESRGSANMKHQMQRLNKPIYEVILRKA